MGRRRTVNHDLPPRMQRKGQSYYYVCAGKWEPLGRDLARAKRAWAEREQGARGLTVGDLVQRYVDTLDNVAPATVTQYQSFQRALADAFPASATALRAHHVAVWRDNNNHRKVYVNGCLAVLHQAWKRGREWGLVEADVSVRPFPKSSRDTYMTDEHYKALHAAAPSWLKVAMSLAYRTALRPVDILKLRWDDPEVRTQKTGVKLRFVQTPELQEAFALARQRRIAGLYVVADDRGQPMTSDQLGWGWRKVRASVGLTQYQFRDIRSKAATDADMDGQDAQRLLGHANRSMTERYIRQRRVTDVDPVRRKL